MISDRIYSNGKEHFNVTLRLENGLGLQVSPDFDCCVVACVDVSNEWVKISFSELKDALFNWEDLHADEVTGFEAESHMLFFGRKGAAHTDTPYMTLSPSGKDDSFRMSSKAMLATV